MIAPLLRAGTAPRAATRAALLSGVAGLLVFGGQALGAQHPRAAARVPGADWTRFDYNAQRTGVGPADTGITASNLRSLRRRVVQLDGTVDSSAVELHAIKVGGHRRDVIILTTTYGRTIALDAGSGKKLWEFVPSDIGNYEGSSQITTATPVIDRSHGYVYASSPDGLIHKLSISNGRQARAAHWPVSVTRDATHEKIASALNISGNSVVVTTGGYIGDVPPYQGHVVTIDEGSGRITHIFNTLCSNRHALIVPSTCPSSDSAIWGRAGAVIEPGSGRILVATGNGPFNGHTDWGDSTLELSPRLGLLHNWTPTDQAQLNDSDTDLGSSAPVLLPSYHGQSLAVQGGKDALLHLLNLRALDGTTGGAGPRLGGSLAAIATPGSGELLTAPSVWTHGGRIYLLVADDSGTAAYFLTGGSHPRLQVAWQNGTAGTSPVVAGGLLYVYDDADGGLNVYNPATGHRLITLPSGSGHWNSPIVVGGRIVLPEGDANAHDTSGTLDIYHLPGF